MPCVSAAPMLQAALKGHYAVAQININKPGMSPPPPPPA